MKIVLIGCGRISKNHLKAIAEMGSKVRLIGVCDSDEDKLKQAITHAKELNLSCEEVKEFKRLEDITDEVKRGWSVDIAVLATPSGCHAEQAIKLGNAGINVCTEKPMATNFGEGMRMVREFEKNGSKLFVVKQNRYNKTIKLLKRQIENNRFGRICMVTVNVFWQRPQTYYDSANWRGTKKMDGGALMNQASHYVDLLAWLIGDLECISAEKATLDRKIECEDTAVMTLKWQNGTLGTMAVTMLTYPENLEGSITVLGTKGTVKIGGKAINNIVEWKFIDETDDDKKVRDASYLTDSVYGHGHSEYYNDMIKDLREGTSSTCDGKGGLKSLEMIQAAYESAETGKKMRLPIQEQIR